MKNFALLTLFLALLSGSLNAQNPYYDDLGDLSAPPLFGSSPFMDSLWAWDTTTFDIVYRSAPVPSTGNAINGMTGITTHPCTGEIYVICKQSATTGRTLGIFNPRTDTVSIIGNLGDNFSSITFRSDGVLFGVTGDGATTSETLYTIDIATATPTLAVALGNGADGEVIAFNKDDGNMYHWSGNGTVVFESFPASSPYTPVTGISGALGSGEVFGAVYRGNGNFLISTINQDFRTLSDAGVVSGPIASFSDYARGLAQTNRWVSLVGAGTICLGDSTELQAMGGEAYQWRLNGNDIAGATSSTFYATQEGWYNCLITTDLTNCATPDTAWFSKYISVNPLPNVGINPSGSAYICSAGDSVLLTGSNGGTSQWYMDGTAISGANTTSYYATSSGTYNMTKTNMNGCTDSSAVSTVVTFAPSGGTITPFGTDTICEPATVVIVATTGADSYQWYDAGGAITGETDDSLTVSASGVYSCVLSYGNCNDTTVTYDLSVLDCSGLEEIGSNQINVYPNPANDEIVLMSDLSLNGELTIYGVDGTLIRTEKASGTTLTLDVSTFQPGTYIINYRDKDSFFNKHFIKL